MAATISKVCRGYKLSFSENAPEDVRERILHFLNWYSEFMKIDMPVNIKVECVENLSKVRFVSFSRPVKKADFVVGWRIVVKCELPKLLKGSDNQIFADELVMTILDLMKNLLYARAEHNDIPVSSRQMDYSSRVLFEIYVDRYRRILPTSIARETISRPIDIVEKVRTLIDFNNHLQAKRLLNTLRKRDDVWKLLMAEVLRQEGLFQKCAKYCKMVIDANHDDLYAYWELSLCMYSAKKYEEALSCVENSLARFSESSVDFNVHIREKNGIVNDFYFLKARCLLGLGQIGKARDAMAIFVEERKSKKLLSCFGRCEIRRTKYALQVRDVSGIKNVTVERLTCQQNGK